jgi:tetratricopeptide (TPR) repeat protein
MPGKVTTRIACAIVLCCAVAAPAGRAQSTHRLDLPQEARDGLDALYRGDMDAAIEDARRMQASAPNSPIGYLLEADARWWKIYCNGLEFKWNMLDVWGLGPSPENDALLAAVEKAVTRGEAQIQHGETAEMHLYTGSALALRARMLGMRGDHRGTARAGVAARYHFLRAKTLDPQLADADMGLGLYNYYIDTLSGFVKVLRFFMGIPGGNKQEGIAELKNAMEHGDMMAVEARFYLSINLRLYDWKYEPAVELMEPLAARYPQNPVFALMLGNMNALLNRKEKAAIWYRAAAAMKIADPKWREHVTILSVQGLASLHAK